MVCVDAFILERCFECDCDTSHCLNSSTLDVLSMIVILLTVCNSSKFARSVTDIHSCRVLCDLRWPPQWVPLLMTRSTIL